MSSDPMHKTVCDRCYSGTWYETERPCRLSWPKRCKCCRQLTGEHTPCGGTLRIIDRSDLAPQFASYLHSGQRIRVRFSHGEERTGTVGKTMGWKPAYLLMARSDSMGSSDLLGAGDQIVGVKYGRTYR